MIDHEIDTCSDCFDCLGYCDLVATGSDYLLNSIADRMNGKGNCAGGVCTGGGTTWSSGANRGSTTGAPKTKTTKAKTNQ